MPTQRASLPLRKKINLFLIFAVAMGGILYGYNIGAMSGVLLFVRTEMMISHFQASFFVASFLFGSLLYGFYRVFSRFYRQKNNHYHSDPHGSIQRCHYGMGSRWYL